MFVEDDKPKIIENSAKTISVSKKEFGQTSTDDRMGYGTFKSGEYNISADFLNVEDKTVTLNARKPKHSELYPYFFLISLPRNSELGILILQTFSTHAIKSLLKEVLSEFLNELAYSSDNDDFEVLKDCTLHFKPLVSKNLLDKLESSEEVHEIKMIKHKLSANRAQILLNKKINRRLTIGDPENIKEVRSFKIKSRKQGFLDKENIIDSLRNVENAYAEIVDEDYDAISVTVTIDGSEKTINFGSRDEYTEVYPLDEKKIDFGQNRFPDYEYLKRTATGYLRYLNGLSD